MEPNTARMERVHRMEKGTFSWVALLATVGIVIIGGWLAWTKVDGELVTDLFALIALGNFVAGVICGSVILGRAVVVARRRRWYLSFVLLVWASATLFVAWVFLGVLVGWVPASPLEPVVQGTYLRPAIPFIIVFPTIALLEVCE